MNAYAYAAALYCEACTLAIQDRLGAVPSWEREDSNLYPQGPYPAGGGEADSPQHCDACNVFLANPLTADGLAYVREHVPADDAKPAPRRSAVVATWREFYGSAL